MSSPAGLKFDGTLWKSELDDKEYRIIELQNGLRAILVSDVRNLINLDEARKNSKDVESKENEIEDDDGENESEDEDESEKGEKMAACAVCVHVGSFSDPPDIPGLAHFLEHMVFMGSKKYPKENALDEFLKKRGGFNNAFTECENTVFTIECREVNLEEGLDVFSQFFISPLMKKEAMTRERESIDAEFELALPSDGSSAEQLLGSFAPPSHPAGFFMWGNLATLRDRVDDEYLYKAVHDFRLRHYSAHRMTVAVVARLSLDTLETFVRNAFSAVPNNGIPVEDFSKFRGLFGQGEFHSLLWVKPVHDLCEVTLKWILPPFINEHEALPVYYLSKLLGNEAKGSLVAFLRKRLWCLKGSAGNDGSGFESNSIYSVFAITLELTKSGLDNLDQVLQAVFIYLATIRETLPSSRIYEEYKDIAKARFVYKDEEDPSRKAENLCVKMHYYPNQYMLCAGEIYMEYKPEAIKSYFDELRPDNVNIMVHLREKPDEYFDLEEPWFKTKYKKEAIPQDWVRIWKEAKPSAEFFLPEPNPYLPKRFSLLESNEVNHPDYPEKVLDTDTIELWYRQDLKFLRPRAIFKMFLRSNLLQQACENVVHLDILSLLVSQRLEEQLYPASEACYSCDIARGDYGLVLSFSGFDEKLPLLFEEVIKGLHSVSQISEKEIELLEDIKTDLSRDYHNKFIKVEDIDAILRMNLLLERYWTPMKKLAALKNISPDSLRAFCRSYFSNVHVQMLVQGNITRDTTIQMAESLPSLLQLSPLAKKPKTIVWNIPHGTETFCRIPSFSRDTNNSAVTLYYQYGPSNGSLRVQGIIDMLGLLMNEPLFDTLRTKQQVGYDVSAEARDTFGILGFGVSAFYQSTKFSADEVYEKVDAFLNEFATILRELSEEEFSEVKESLAAMKRIVDFSLEQEASRNFVEITSGEYIFNRLPQEAEIIPTITKEEVCDWYEKRLDLAGKCKKLVVQIEGKNESGKPGSGDDSEPHSFMPIAPNEKFITDIEAFKLSRKFYPPQPAL